MGKKFKSENNNISLHFLFIGTKYKKYMILLRVNRFQIVVLISINKIGNMYRIASFFQIEKYFLFLALFLIPPKNLFQCKPIF